MIAKHAALSKMNEDAHAAAKASKNTGGSVLQSAAQSSLGIKEQKASEPKAPTPAASKAADASPAMAFNTDVGHSKTAAPAAAATPSEKSGGGTKSDAQKLDKFI